MKVNEPRKGGLNTFVKCDVIFSFCRQLYVCLPENPLYKSELSSVLFSQHIRMYGFFPETGDGLFLPFFQFALHSNFIISFYTRLKGQHHHCKRDQELCHKLENEPPLQLYDMKIHIHPQEFFNITRSIYTQIITK